MAESNSLYKDHSAENFKWFGSVLVFDLIRVEVGGW